MGMLLLVRKQWSFNNKPQMQILLSINLLHSLFGIAYYNILDSPSNGFELLHFFEDAVEIKRPDGSILLEQYTMVSLLSQF